MGTEKNNFNSKSFELIENNNGQKFVIINNSLATAKIALQGAHVMQWKPHAIKHQVLWLSSQAKYIEGRSIRGGVPICWPWFGAHPTDGSFCTHGFARVIPWIIQSIDDLESGATQIKLFMVQTSEVTRQLSYKFELKILITIGKSIHLNLETSNLAAQPFTIGEGYHTYFQISDIEKIRISGLENVLYSDKINTYQKSKQQSEITFNDEFDRAYLNTQNSCLIYDEGLKRIITVKKEFSDTTVVWTPWEKKAKEMGDMGQDGEWRTMVCVENVNTLENAVIVYPNQTHSLIAEYLVQEI